MAALTTSAVTAIRRLGEHSGKRMFHKTYYKVVFTGQGANTAANAVPASAFMLHRFTEPAFLSEAVGTYAYTLVPSPSTDEGAFGEFGIVVGQSTGAINLYGTFYGVVEGIQ